VTYHIIKLKLTNEINSGLSTSLQFRIQSIIDSLSILKVKFKNSESISDGAKWREKIEEKLDNFKQN